MLMKAKKPKRVRKPRGIDDRLGQQHTHPRKGQTTLDPIPGPVNHAAVARFNEARRRRNILRKFKDDRGRVEWRVVRVIYKHAAQ